MPRPALRQVVGHLLERAVAEDHVGRHVAGLRQPPTQVAQAGKQVAVEVEVIDARAVAGAQSTSSAA